MADLGLTHVALPVTDMQRSLDFYERYAGMKVVHHRGDPTGQSETAWLSDLTRAFVIVLLKVPAVEHPLRPMAHLGVGCESRAEVDRRCEIAREEQCLRLGPIDSGPPVGYWALLADPDEHTLELAYGQEVGLTVDRAAKGRKSDP